LIILIIFGEEYKLRSSSLCTLKDLNIENINIYQWLERFGSFFFSFSATNWFVLLGY
jgi:hypothetical protein